MIAVQKALEIIQRHLPSVKKEAVPLCNALGRVILEDISSPEPSPRYTQSAMDGFAVCWEDVQSVRGNGPVRLAMKGESRAGIPFSGKNGSGRAVRISTGAMLPEGTDTVVPVEETEVESDRVLIRNVKKAYQHVRIEGEEIQRGDLLIPKGTTLNPPQIALLASMGIAEVPVCKVPTISILATGTELIRYDRPVKRWQIRDSNRVMLASAVEKAGAKIVFMEQVEDDLSAIKEAIERASDQSDIVLISGGVSVGPHDHVKEAVRQNGFEPLFWKVKQKPGKPLFFAKKRDRLLFGLPGNPVSAFMCYTYYVYPIIRNLKGDAFQWRTIQGKLGKTLQNSSYRTHLTRVKMERNGNRFPRVMPTEKQGSHMLTSIAYADGFLVLERGQSFKPGDLVEVYCFP